ncbi:MAG: outer membrane lipoprotein-sorting protein [bacterium]
MRLDSNVKFFFLTMIFVVTQHVSSQTTDLQGQLSGWTYLRESSLSESQFGLRYIPTLSVEKRINDELVVDSELSLKTFGSGTFDSPDEMVDNGEVKTYRLWLRFSASQFEVRVGLQKINFGSATLLRPLMWFDRIDPRDPLQLTDGVYGLLGRYYFLNNANVWLWGLYGNDETKGWEAIPTDDQSVEYGGRFQYPVGSGEIALTYHHRKADLSKSPLSLIVAGDSTISENRLALDGKWDLEIGLWFEGVVIHQNSEVTSFEYRNFFTLGADYTFSIGTGLHVLGEHLLFAMADEPFGTDESINLSALLMDYNLGLLDRLIAIVYYDWDNRQFFRYASWGRIYDNWSFYVNTFWNPEENMAERTCWVLQLTAIKQDVAYHSRKIWVDKERYIPLREDRYAKSGKLLKTTEVKEVMKVGERWVYKHVIFKDVLKRRQMDKRVDYGITVS